MHVILTGATGLVGGAALDALLNRKEITKISIISRREVKQVEDRKDPRVNVILHNDFHKYDDELLAKLEGARGCIWALGISQTMVQSDREYEEITKDFPLAASKAFQSKLATPSSPFNFVYISAKGADPESKVPQVFRRVKGDAEKSLASVRNDLNPDFRSCSLRPAWVDPSGHDAIKPYLPPVPSLVLRVATGVLGPFIRANVGGWRTVWSPTRALGPFAVDMVLGKHDEEIVKDVEAGKPDVLMLGKFPIIENTAMRRLAKFDS